MGFEGFYSLPSAAQIGIIGFAVALVLLVIAQLFMAASLRNRSRSAALDSIRNDMKSLTRHGDVQAVALSSNGLAPPPRPVKRRGRSVSSK